MTQNYQIQILHYSRDHCETGESGGSAEGNEKYQPPNFNFQTTRTQRIHTVLKNMTKSKLAEMTKT